MGARQIAFLRDFYILLLIITVSAVIYYNPIESSPISGGDVYAAVTLNTNNSNFDTSFIVLPDRSTYAVVITDLVAAQAFVATYPVDRLPGTNPEFPQSIFDEMGDLVDEMGSTVEGRTKAMAFILNKHNAGITLMKQDNNGKFIPYKIEVITQNGNTTYILKPCN